MSDISEYSTTQQKVIKEIVTNDNGFHSSYMIADMPFYGMLTELENGQISVRSNVTCPLSTGSVDYELQLFYSSERSCWFYVMSNSDDEIRGIVRYNTVVNAKGELAGAFAFGGADVQANLLRADGIEVIDNKVDLTKYGL